VPDLSRPAASPRLSRGLRVFGHPLHPGLAAFPVAFLSGALVADVIALWRGDPFWWAVSFWIALAGVVAAAPTALAGLIDYAAIPEGHGGLKTATFHLTAMLIAVGCFGVDLVLRGGPAAPSGAAVASTVALHASGTVILLAGGWLGGELVFRHGVAVEAPHPPAAASGEGASPESEARAGVARR
jgi:uncharacterized membrane protein